MVAVITVAIKGTKENGRRENIIVVPQSLSVIHPPCLVVKNPDHKLKAVLKAVRNLVHLTNEAAF